MNGQPPIFLVDLSKLRGLSGQILGQLVIATLQQTLTDREHLPEKDRLPTFLYIDEFALYAASSEQSFKDLFERARKYRVGVCIAHQVLSDIPATLRDVIIGNVGTVCTLAVGAGDAPFFARDLQIRDEKGTADPERLQNLGQGQAVIRTPEHKSGILVDIPYTPVDDPDGRVAEAHARWRAKLIEFAKKKHGKRKAPPDLAPESAPTPDSTDDTADEEGFWQ
jgi:hypothetical protein